MQTVCKQLQVIPRINQRTVHRVPATFIVRLPAVPVKPLMGYHSGCSDSHRHRPEVNPVRKEKTLCAENTVAFTGSQRSMLVNASPAPSTMASPCMTPPW